jgi:hypothetical protein
MEQASGASSGRWVRGRGYNHDFLAERRHPTRHDLDSVSDNRPVLISHASGHVVSCNSVALRVAGIDANTPVPEGGEIEHDEGGMPTGVLKETAMPLVVAAAPPPTHAEARDAILRAMDRLAVEGITSVSDAMTGHDLPASQEATAYRAALESGRMKGRIVLMPQIMHVAPVESEKPAMTPGELDVGGDPECLRVGAVKIFSDGAITTRTAALRTHYQGTNNAGLPTWHPEQLASMVSRAHAAGWQIATHAMGDGAIEMTLKAYEAAQKASPRTNPRHRIEHCSLPDETLTRRILSLGVVPVVQPELIARFGDSYVAGLGREWANNAMPLGWFKHRGIEFGLSSDRPVVSGSPLVGVSAAMLRTTPEGRVLGQEHRLTAEEALYHYAVGAAYATFCEGEKGRLAPGFLADLTVLDRDITKVSAEEIPSLKVTMTVVGGEIVHAV